MTKRLHLSSKSDNHKLVVYPRGDFIAASIINGDIIQLDSLPDTPYAVVIDSDLSDTEISVVVINGGEQGMILTVSLDMTEFLTLYAIEG